ncbi:indole-3-glycerol phosphate synthase TrpC [Marinicella sp. W31]|uniref:indole-3-glycerol phosphate synthase TrpC n=1 Tax=Marinicella sp. W31 TaxID=3023713 RepID=UPI00375645D4
MTDILSKILQTKSEEVIAGAQQQSLQEISTKIDALPATKGFLKSLHQSIETRGAAVIAEVKKASPSKGIIRSDFDPQSIAKSYDAAGAACLSVLTDQQYFQGNDAYINQVRAVSDLPILRKDFMIDAWQIYQSRLLGADCILLIVAALGDAQLLELTILAHELGMDVLTEVHNEEELERALQTPTQMIGINNRNLKTFETSLDVSIRLKQRLNNDLLVISESGIHSHDDVKRLQQHDISTFLIGESFMRQDDPGAALQNIVFNQ